MHFKKAALLFGVLALSTAAIAQQAKAKKTAYVDGNNTYTFSTTNGIRKEYIETEYDGVDYEMKLLNGKLTELHVDGKLIQPSDYGKYLRASQPLYAGIYKRTGRAVTARRARARPGASLNVTRSRLQEIRSKPNVIRNRQ